MTKEKALKSSALLLICACAAVVMSGCFEKSEVRFGVHGDYASGITPSVHVSFFDGLRFHEVTLDSLNRTAGPYSTKSSGDLKIVCSVLSTGGVPAAEDSFALDLKDDWRWGIDFFFSENNPIETCFGCMGFRAIELDPSLGLGDDVLLYIVWGGNSISNPVVY